MTPELVTFKLDKDFLSEVDKTAKGQGFANRTDFIRSSLREKVDEIKLKKAMIELSQNFGKSKKKITDKNIHDARQKVANEYLKKFK